MSPRGSRWQIVEGAAPTRAPRAFGRPASALRQVWFTTLVLFCTGAVAISIGETVGIGVVFWVAVLAIISLAWWAHDRFIFW